MADRATALKDIVMEIGMEEIPSRFISPTVEMLKTLAAESFEQARIPFREILVYATPRRLALFVCGVAERQEDRVATFKGPLWSSAFDSVGNSTRAAEGFAKNRGVTIDDLKPVDMEGGCYAVAEVRQAGQAVHEILPNLLPSVIEKLSFPKSMYWSNPGVRFARPVRWIVALFGKDVIPFVFGDVKSDRFTSGHRFLGSRCLEIGSTGEYMEKLYDNYVILDPEKRKQKLLAGIATFEQEHNGVVELDPELIEENLYLVEYPVPFVGTFDERFLEIPEEVLVTSMKKNQKYFAIRTREGKLMNSFVGVSNNRPVNMNTIRGGNERVLRARLQDAAFFWEEDLKHPLGANVERLKGVIYQEKLGSVYDKVMETQKLALWLCEKGGMSDISKLVERAAFLSKADLVSHMVYEFPELQGVMGREYALRSGEDPRVALALYEQYLPRSAADSVPADNVGAVLGLAERIHIIVSCYKAGLEPTGSQDPYALRRAARCINEILWERELDTDIEEAVKTSAAANKVDDAVVKRILAFLNQRLLMQLKEKGFEHELAGMAIAVTGRRPLQVARLLKALSAVRKDAWFGALVTAAVRVHNILQKAKSEETADDVDASVVSAPAETALRDKVTETGPQVEAALAKNDWAGLMSSLAELSPVVTAFFDDVMVMDSDPKVRANRLALLQRCNTLFKNVGNLSVLKS